MDNDKAIQAWMARYGEALEKIELIHEYMNGYTGTVNPDDVSWAHVGTLGAIVQALDNVMEHLEIETEDE
jgi:hypothetical protein